MPVIDNINYPDTLREMESSKDNALAASFKEFWPSMVTTNDRVFLKNAKSPNVRNAHDIFETSGLHKLSKCRISLSAKNQATIRKQMNRGYRTIDAGVMVKTVNNMVEMLQTDLKVLGLKDFYKSDQFADYLEFRRKYAAKAQAARVSPRENARMANDARNSPLNRAHTQLNPRRQPFDDMSDV